MHRGSFLETCFFAFHIFFFFFFADVKMSVASVELIFASSKYSLAVKALDSQSRGLVFKTSGWLHS